MIEWVAMNNERKSIYWDRSSFEPLTSIADAVSEQVAARNADLRAQIDAVMAANPDKALIDDCGQVRVMKDSEVLEYIHYLRQIVERGDRIERAFVALRDAGNDPSLVLSRVMDLRAALEEPRSFRESIA